MSEQGIGIYEDVLRFSGTGAFLGKEGLFECLRVKSGMKLVFAKGIDSKHFTLYTIGHNSNRWEMVK